MTQQFTDYQWLATRTLAASDTPNTQLAILGLGLAGETGELVDHLKKVLGHGHDFDLAKIKEEAGDVLWYLAVILDLFDIDLQDVAAANIDKLTARYPDGFSSERSRNRA